MGQSLMKVVRPEFLPDASLSGSEMEGMQREISSKAIFRDSFDFPESLEDVKVAGIDQAFTDEKAVSGVVVMENGEVVEKDNGVTDLEIPYIPGLLAFREGSCIVKALEKLENEPDLLVLDGSGRIHFREAGIATHVGVIFDTPSIGVAKSLLCGELEKSVDNLEKGEKVRILSDGRMEGEENRLIGYAFQSRQFNSGKRSITPLYVSPGHRLSEDTSVNLVEKLPGDYKLSEPVRLADKYVDEIKQEID